MPHSCLAGLRRSRTPSLGDLVFIARRMLVYRRPLALPCRQLLIRSRRWHGRSVGSSPGDHESDLKPVRKRKLVDEMRGDWDVSIEAYRVFLIDTSTCSYQSRRPGQAALEHRIKEICQTRVRYGYRRVHVLLRREGWFSARTRPGHRS